ncbi:MAG: hypothetical protein R3E93_07360 [Thiothrix sp.]
MTDIVVYDKVSWHYPEGKNCPSLEAAKIHFLVMMKWLKENNLLSTEGEEVWELGVDADFSITSTMLNEKGKNILDKHYSIWLKTIDYSKNIDLKILERSL